jgi:hypothetical protein
MCHIITWEKNITRGITPPLPFSPRQPTRHILAVHCSLSGRGTELQASLQLKRLLLAYVWLRRSSRMRKLSVMSLKSSTL